MYNCISYKAPSVYCLKSKGTYGGPPPKLCTRVPWAPTEMKFFRGKHNGHGYAREIIQGAKHHGNGEHFSKVFKFHCCKNIGISFSRGRSVPSGLYARGPMKEGPPKPYYSTGNIFSLSNNVPCDSSREGSYR